MRIGFRLVVGLTILLMLSAGLVIFISSPMFTIQSFEIELEKNAANPYIFPKIRDALNVKIKNIKGQSIWAVDLDRLLAQVEGDQRIKEARVQRVLPNRILVQISPYTAVANVMGASSDRLHPVAPDGQLMPAVAALDAPDGPVMRGQEFIKEIDLRKGALALLKELPEEGTLSGNNISEIDYSRKSGFRLIVSPSGHEVWMGIEDFKNRSHQAQKVIDYLEESHLTGRIIDARFTKKVVVRLRNEP